MYSVGYDYGMIDFEKLVISEPYNTYNRTMGIRYKSHSSANPKYADLLCFKLPDMWVSEVSESKGTPCVRCLLCGDYLENPQVTRFMELLHKMHVACAPMVIANKLDRPYCDDTQSVVDSFKLEKYVDNTFELREDEEALNPFYVDLRVYSGDDNELFINLDSSLKLSQEDGTFRRIQVADIKPGYGINTTVVLYGVNREIMHCPQRFEFNIVMAIHEATLTTHAQGPPHPLMKYILNK